MPAKLPPDHRQVVLAGEDERGSNEREGHPDSFSARQQFVEEGAEEKREDGSEIGDKRAFARRCQVGPHELSPHRGRHSDAED
nr:hypothetical protein [Natronococcus sp. AD5]